MTEARHNHSIWQRLKNRLRGAEEGSNPQPQDVPAQPERAHSAESERPDSAEPEPNPSESSDNITQMRLKLIAILRNPSLLNHVTEELRTPLTMILAPLESILMGDAGAVTAEQKRRLSGIHQNATKLLQLVSSLVDLSQIEGGDLQVRRAPLDIVALTRSIVLELGPAAARHHIELRFAPSSESVLVSMDRYMYERILFNLLSTTIRFTHHDGQITVALEMANNDLTLSVCDNALGLDEQQLATLFKRPQDLGDESTRRSHAAGLGLALVKDFASLLGGSVSTRRLSSKETVLTVTLKAPLCPVVAKPAQPEKSVSAKAPPGLAGDAIASGAPILHELPLVMDVASPGASFKQPLYKVLIAEPNEELAAYVAELLGDICQTRIALDGERALEQACEWRADLVLAAVLLPKLDGFDLCRAIKARADTAMTPVILLTALTQRESMLKGWEAGADEYLFKPFHPAELVTRVRSLLRSVQQRRRAQEQIERLNEALEKRVIELAAANRELKSLASKVGQARDQALEASRFKSVFLANMSHEIRTPINGVIAMSDMLVRTQMNEEQTEIASIIRDSAGALLDIINDILDFSKIEAGKLELEIVDFDLVNVVEGTCELVAEQARAKRLSLMSYISPDIPLVLRGDPGRLRQILLNLLSNAIKFTEQGEVLVQATLDSKDDGRCVVRISVEDSGIGMAQDAVHRLFQPFTQADGSITRKYGGTGLGLSIAKLLVELLGGKIGVRSAHGTGSTFWFSVPLERAVDVPPSTSKFNLEDTRVLIVDPLVGTAKILDEYIKSWGMHSSLSRSAGEALDLMRHAAQQKQPFDVAIVELSMPDMDGFKLARAVKALPQIAHTHLILCTSNDQDTLGETALAAGFSAYLIKPLKQSRLYDCLALVLNRDCKKWVSLEPSTKAPRLNTTSEMNMFQETGMVLVAEDNPVNQKVALLLLKELGFAAHVVASGREAVEAVSRAPYSMILMDCQMPEMDGFEATSAIRRGETLTGKHIPIIAMTAHAMQGDRDKCIAAGMDDYVSKPVTAIKLKEVLLRWFKPESSSWRGATEASLAELSRPSTQTATAESGASALSPSSQSKAGQGANEENLLNQEQLRISCGEEGMRELLGIFLESTADLFGRMETALLAKDSKKLKNTAHEMKGACASVGSTEMATHCKSLETAALAEDWTEARSLIDSLSNIFARVEALCRQILESPSPA